VTTSGDEEPEEGEIIEEPSETEETQP
jgi:hypothetical protein